MAIAVSSGYIIKQKVALSSQPKWHLLDCLLQLFYGFWMVTYSKHFALLLSH